MIDPAILKRACTETIDPILESLKRGLAEETQKLEIGLGCDVFTREQAATLRIRLARREGELEGVVAAWHWIQQILDLFAKHEAERQP